MTGTEWPVEFEKLLRTYLPLLEDDVPLGADDSLTDLGLDSLSTVGLLVDIEEELKVQFPDDLLTAATFATPTSLWRVIDKLGGEAG